ncbi:MAG: hypothetical protein GY811_08035 [Myxococcales bacterium]|nr:hypothetical protein [Myxococcales bacterium]
MSGDPITIEISGPGELRLGETAEFQALLADREIELPGLHFEWTLRPPDGLSVAELDVGTDGSAQITPDLLGLYRISCVGVYDEGRTRAVMKPIFARF